LPIYTPSNNISFSHIVKPYLIFSVSEIVPIPIGSISDFCLFIFAPVLKKFGFGDVFIKWIMIFYNKINSTVKCNGFLTKYFSIENAIRQRCPISALLYVLAAEPLQCNIKMNSQISGIQIPNSDKEALCTLPCIVKCLGIHMFNKVLILATFSLQFKLSHTI
jgi:hypothetical protein